MRLRFGTFVFDSRLRELSRGGTRVPLTPKAFALLEALIDARPQPLSREALVRILWPDAIVEPGNLHNLISEIRGALDDDGHRVIRTVHRFGYGFEAAGPAEEGLCFVVAIGPDVVPLRSGENTIGRDPSDTIVIHAPDVSRRHARIVIEGGRATVEDLGSKNGTFVGSKRLTGPAEIQPGDEILIGTTRLVLLAAGELPATMTAT